MRTTTGFSGNVSGVRGTTVDTRGSFRNAAVGRADVGTTTTAAAQTNFGNNWRGNGTFADWRSGRRWWRGAGFGTGVALGIGLGWPYYGSADYGWPYDTYAYGGPYYGYSDYSYYPSNDYYASYGYNYYPSYGAVTFGNYGYSTPTVSGCSCAPTYASAYTGRRYHPRMRSHLAAY